MAVRKATDVYANRAITSITMSAANTLTFQQIRFAVGLFQGVAIVVHRVDYAIYQATAIQIAANTDWIRFGLTLSDQVSDLSEDDPRVVAAATIIGMGAAVEPMRTPVTIDLTNLPEKGVLLPANPLYLGMESGGLATAGRVDVQVWFSFKQLADKDYIELLQSSIPSNI